MKGKKSSTLTQLGALGALLCGSALLGCSSTEAGNGKPTGVGTGGTSGTGPSNCDGAEVAMPKRIIRLSFSQVANSFRPAFGDAFATKIVTDNAITPSTERSFPPLGDTREGSSYIDTKWQSADAIAKSAGEQVLANFAAFTACSDAPTTECAQAFVAAHAERAYRRPLTDREKASVLQVYSYVVTNGGTIQQATQAAVWAIYDSPHFLYRTELGAAAGAEVALTPYELASQLSFFLTDGPPDAELLTAAAQNKLTTPAEISPHVDRLLELPAVRANLQDTVFASYGIARVLAVVIDGLPPADFNAGVANSMFRESQLFINNVLWNGGTVPDLATSRKTFVNANIAPLYGVAPPSVGLDADGFGPVDLPDNRSGIITSLGFLTSRSRPDQQSVVGRGLAVNDAILCQSNPPFPEALASQIEQVNMNLADQSERQKAEYRATTTPCLGCHQGFDPYGLSLENFDLIGRFRTADEKGRPIDASVTLPAAVGGAVVPTAVEMGKSLAASGAFSACLAMKLMTYALAETGVSSGSCATRAVTDRFSKTDLSFKALVREVAMSKTLTHRSGG